MSPWTLLLCVCFTQLLLVHSEITDLTCDDEGLQELKISWKKSGAVEDEVFGESGQSVIAIGYRNGVVLQYRFVPSTGGENGHWVLKHKEKVHVLMYCDQMQEKIEEALSSDDVTAIKIGRHMVKGATIVLINENRSRSAVLIRFTDIHGVAQVHRINSDSNASDKTISIGANRYLFRKFESPNKIEWMKEAETTSFHDTDWLQRFIMTNIGGTLKITIGPYMVQNGETIETIETKTSTSKVESDEWDGLCKCTSEDECDVPLSAKGDFRRGKLEEPIAKHLSPIHIDYEFYGTKTSEQGGVERNANEIKCNGVTIFSRDMSKPEPDTQPWNWNWIYIFSATHDVYAHIDGLIFMNLKTKHNVQLLPKTKKKFLRTAESIVEKTGCEMQHEISYIGRWWAFENGDLANYNLYMWTMGYTRVVEEERTTSHSAMYCNGNHVQWHNYCQLYAQNNVLQYEVDSDESYADFSHTILGRKETMKHHKAEGHGMNILIPGLERFGVTSMDNHLLATPERLEEITPEYMDQMQCIGVLIRYFIEVHRFQISKMKKVHVGNGGHFIVYKYLRPLGWYALDANVNDPFGPFVTLLEAEQFANGEQIRTSKGAWKIYSTSILLVNKDVKYFKEKYKSTATSTATSAATAKQEVYDDVMNYANGYDSYETYEANYGSGATGPYIENVLWGVSMEIMILLLFLCCGLYFLAIIYIGFICSCLGFAVSYLVPKYQQNVKIMENQIQSNDEEV